MTNECPKTYDPADDGPETQLGPALLQCIAIERAKIRHEMTIEVEREFCRKVGVDV